MASQVVSKHVALLEEKVKIQKRKMVNLQKKLRTKIKKHHNIPEPPVFTPTCTSILSNYIASLEHKTKQNEAQIKKMLNKLVNVNKQRKKQSKRLAGAAPTPTY